MDSIIRGIILGITIPLGILLVFGIIAGTARRTADQNAIDVARGYSEYAQVCWNNPCPLLRRPIPSSQ